MNNFYSKLRWVIMTLSFIIMTFGVYIIGIKIPNKYAIPIFACPLDTEGSVTGSCYTLCHLRLWSETTPLDDIIFFIIYTLLIIIVFGRLLCGFICPVGFIQDIIDKIRQFFKFDQIKFSENSYKILAVIKWSMLLIFLFGGIVWSFNFCDICPVLMFTPPLAGVKMIYSISLITGVLFIVFSFFKRRFFCTVCPLGFLIGLFHRISFVSLKKDCQSCTECGACYEACPMGIKSIFTEREKKRVSTENCLMCIECINKCPEKEALSLSYLGIKIYKASRKNFFRNQGYKG